MPELQHSFLLVVQARLRWIAALSRSPAVKPNDGVSTVAFTKPQECRQCSRYRLSLERSGDESDRAPHEPSIR